MTDDRQTDAAPRRRSPLVVIFLTVFIDLVGFGIVIPLLPVYARELGASDLTAGLLLATYSFMQFLAAPFWGRLSDKIGRRPVLLISLAASTTGYLLFALSRDLPSLFFSRAVAGIGGANIAVAQAYIADITTEANRTKGMGMIGMAFGFGFILGPALSAVAIHFFGHSGPGWLAALICGLNLAAAFVRLPETHAPDQRVSVAPAEIAHSFTSIFRSIGYALSLPNVRFALIIFAISVFSFAHFESTFAFFLRDRLGLPTESAGYFFAYIAVLMAIVQGGLVGRLAKKVGDRRLVLVGLLLSAIGLLLFIPVHQRWLLFLAGAPFALGFGFNNPLLSSIVSRGTPKQDQGRVLGAMQSLGSLMRILGPAAGTFLYGRFGQSGPYAFAGSLMLLAFLGASARLRGAPQTSPS
jgi:multidrug resistance protein